MTDFDQVLETCLDEITNGASSLDECLLRYPEYAAQLKPLLQTAARLEQGHALQPSPVFKARTRAKLTLHMQAHPRKQTQFGFVFWRSATNLMMIVLLFLIVTSTAYAQSTLPGDSLYNWKLASERIWRAISPSPARVDIAIANRRIEEMIAVANDPIRFTLALKGYEEVVIRLQAEVDAETLKNILPVINATDTPEQSVSTPVINETVAPLSASTSVPLPSLPVTVPTKLPKIIPTIEIPPLP